MIEVFAILAITLLLAWPLGEYLALVYAQDAPEDRFARLVERPLYRLIGVQPGHTMSVREYLGGLLASNLGLGAVAFAIFLLQGRLPLNPDGVAALRWDTALHTAVSFMTNTNQQHYSGQAQLSYFSQLFGLVTLQFVSAASGLAMAVAVLRGLRGDASPGNFWVDLTRTLTRVLLPLSLILAVLLGAQGVPSTYSGAVSYVPLDASAATSEQRLSLGPVAPMVAIKQIGTNGGGWYGPNSATPLENPTPLSNALQLAAILLLPVAIVFMMGRLLGRWRFAIMVFAVMATWSAAFVSLAIYSERSSQGALSIASPGPNLEGKEVRFGADNSALWATLTTQTSNGSVNAMHDSLNPLAGGVTLSGMFVNAIWGGLGCGLINFIVYVWLTVFLAGLMVGRTPEIFGRKLEVPEVRWLTVLVVLPPLVILGLSAVTLAVPGLAQTSNPGFHGVSQVVYEYTSAYANNGSGFEGLGDATSWWNLSCVLALLLGRYLPLAIPLVVASRLAAKRAAPESGSSLSVDTPLFGATLLFVTLLLTLLTFLPVLVLGPIAEGLSLAAQP